MEDCQSIQQDMDQLDIWAKKWQIKFNLDKCNDKCESEVLSKRMDPSENKSISHARSIEYKS